MSVQHQLVSSAVLCQLSFNLSALACNGMQFICYDRPTARHQLSYEVQAPLHSVISAAICLLSHDLSAWQQPVCSVKICHFGISLSARLNSRVSAQLSCYLEAQSQLVSSGQLQVVS